MTFLEEIRTRARARRRRIVFPEANDPRVAEAVLWLAREGLVDPILVGRSEELHDLGYDDPRLVLIDPGEDPEFDRLAMYLLDRRRARGMTESGAVQAASHPVLYAALLVANGYANGAVAGATHSTAEVLRAALWALGPADGINTISGAFYMVTREEGTTSRLNRVFTFADAAVVPDPNPLQLAEIAVAAAAARPRVVGDEPAVAFLSYSTHGSAGGESVEKVREALAIFRDLQPRIPADGELQVDAAIVESVGRRKAPDSPVAGRANVLIFPDLDAANIGYKLVERLGGARAIGPIVQGLKRPYNDLSRGASVEDIVNVACITALMS